MRTSPQKEMPSGPAEHSLQHQNDHRTAGQSIAQVIDPSSVYGATLPEWTHVDLILGLTDDVLPIVSNPNRKISQHSKLDGGQLGKVPSIIGRDGMVVGLAKWTERVTTGSEIAQWIKESDYGIGLQCRTVRAVDVDIEDASKAQEIRQAIVEHLGYLPPVRGRQNSSKFLMPFRVEHDEDIRKKVIKTDRGNIELLGNGQQFVFAGMHPKGCRYAWEGGLPQVIPNLTFEQWRSLAAMLEKKFGIEPSVTMTIGRKGQGNGQAPDEDPLGDFLDEKGWTVSEDRDGTRHIRCPFEDGHSMGTPGDGSTSYFPPDKDFARGHFKCLHASCAGRTDGDFLEAVEYGKDMFADLIVPVSPLDPPVKPGYERDKTGSILATKDNLVKALTRKDICGVQIRFDCFRGEVMLSPPEGDGVDGWRMLKDSDYIEIALRLEKDGFKDIAKDKMRDILDYVSGLNQFDSAQHWLEHIVPAWDGIERIEHFLPDCFGTDDNEYTRAVGLYTWTALAGRALVPGIKADMVPVAVGAQGAKKSSTVRTMAPSEEFFLELDMSKKEEDKARLMRGRLVIELGELRGMRTKDSDQLKSFITRTHENWIEKFKTNATTYARRGILFGTTNRDDFLADDTGHRRWLPFMAGECNPDTVETNRLQLWAEARDRFKRDGILWEVAEILARGEHEHFIERDPWEEAVKEYLSDIPHDAPVVSSTIARLGLNIETKKIDRGVEMRIGRVMRALGYKNCAPRIGGKKVRAWRKAT